MIHRINLGYKNVLAYRVEGEIDEQDMQESQDEIKPELESDTKFNLYVELTDTDGVEPAAIKERVSFLFSNFGDIMKKVDKVALVTDKNWLQNVASGIYTLIPGIEQKSFSFEEAAQAREWITS